MLDAIRTLLTDSSPITDIVGERIFPFVREEETPMPAIMMELREIAPIDTNSGAKASAYTIDVYAYSQTAQQASALMVLIRAALDRVEGPVLTYNVAHSHIASMDMSAAAGGRVFMSSVSSIFHIIE